MGKLPLYNSEGTKTGEAEAPEALFGASATGAVLHQAILARSAAERQGTHSTKTRAEVSGSGRKLWRQKGTGRARVGDSRPPNRRGGGVAMGPRARSHRQRLSRRLKKDALREALSVQAQAAAVMLIEPFALTEAKTRLLASLLEALGAQGPTLLVLEKPDPVLWRCGRNLAGFVVKGADDVSAYEVLRARKVIITTDALTRLEARAS